MYDVVNYSKVLMIFQVSLEVFADPKSSGTTRVLAGKWRKPCVFFHEMIMDYPIIGVAEIAYRAFPAVLER